MNDKRKPSFQTSGKSFQERCVGEKRHQNRPRFDDKSRDSRDEKFRAPRDKEVAKETKITQLSLSRAPSKYGESRQVQVTVKSTGTVYKTKEKKTGALSPRAPEKIKKNRAEEMKVYGENASLALFVERPESIVRLWATVQMSHKIGEVLSYLAENKKAYHVVDSEELARVSGTEHHGGICLLVKKQRTFTLQGYLNIPREEDCLVLLDNVNNAQNIGGVLRTCAYFGVKNIVADNVENLYSAASMRVAEGGAEYVRVLEADYADTALAQLRQAGYQIVHVSHNKQGDSLDKVRLKNKVVFVLSEGSTESLAEKQDTQVRLTLASPIKNGLNIAVNAGVLLAKWYFK